MTADTNRFSVPHKAVPPTERSPAVRRGTVATVGSALGALAWAAVKAATATVGPAWRRERLRAFAFTRFREGYIGDEASWIRRQGYDEPETRAWIDNCIENGSVVWDVGANVGQFTLYCASRWPASRIVAIEPASENFAVLCSRVNSRRLNERVMPLPVALAARARLTEIALSSNLAGSVRNVLAGATDQYGVVPKGASQAVLAVQADGLVAQFSVPPPQHIKVDVDGLEPEILAGARKLLHGVKTVLIEVKGRLRGIQRPSRNRCMQLAWKRIARSA